MDLDLKILKSFRSLTGRSASADAVIAFFATWLFYLLLATAAVSALEGDAVVAGRAIRVVLVAIIAVLAAEALSWGMSVFLYRERPFTHLKFKPLVWMPPRWKSFPSDHTTIAFTISFVFLFLGSPLAPLFLILSALIAASRIAAGVHYPSDVLAGFVLALVVSAIVVRLSLSYL